MELTEFLSRASPFCLTEITVNFFSFGFFHVPGDHLSGKLGNVREFDSCQEIRKLLSCQSLQLLDAISTTLV